MSKHVEGCEWEGIHKFLKCETPSGDEEYLSIEENMLHHVPGFYSRENDRTTILFYYCPVCGCEL